MKYTINVREGREGEEGEGRKERERSKETELGGTESGGKGRCLAVFQASMR